MQFGWENLKTGKFLQVFCFYSLLFCSAAVADPERGGEEIYKVSELHSFLSHLFLESERIKKEVSHFKKVEEGANC